MVVAASGLLIVLMVQPQDLDGGVFINRFEPSSTQFFQSALGHEAALEGPDPQVIGRSTRDRRGRVGKPLDKFRMRYGLRVKMKEILPFARLPIHFAVPQRVV